MLLDFNIRKYEKVFIEQASLGYNEFYLRYGNTKKYQNLLERRDKLNKRFVFNDLNVIKIGNVNQELDKKFREAYNQAEEMEQFILSRKDEKDSIVSDYEIDFKLSLFADRKYANVEELRGYPFFEFKPSIGFHKINNGTPEQRLVHKDWLLNSNHNESNNLLKHQYHCWLLSELYNNTYLAWQDIVDVESVWINVVARIQNVI